jgi:Flp pilus assembly protein TadG
VVLVEFAVILPVLLLIIFGIIDYGRFINYSQQESQMAGQGARWAAVNVNPGSSGTLQSYVASQAMGGLQSSGGDVTSAAQVYLYFPTGSSNAIGNPVRACVVSSVQLLPILGGATLKIVQSATMRIEVAGTWTADTVATAASAGCPTT